MSGILGLNPSIIQGLTQGLGGNVSIPLRNFLNGKLTRIPEGAEAEFSDSLLSLAQDIGASGLMEAGEAVAIFSGALEAGLVLGGASRVSDIQNNISRLLRGTDGEEKEREKARQELNRQMRENPEQVMADIQSARSQDATMREIVERQLRGESEGKGGGSEGKGGETERHFTQDDPPLTIRHRRPITDGGDEPPLVDVPLTEQPEEDQPDQPRRPRRPRGDLTGGLKATLIASLLGLGYSMVEAENIFKNISDTTNTTDIPDPQKKPDTEVKTEKIPITGTNRTDTTTNGDESVQIEPLERPEMIDAGAEEVEETMAQIVNDSIEWVKFDQENERPPMDTQLNGLWEGYEEEQKRRFSEPMFKTPYKKEPIARVPQNVLNLAELPFQLYNTQGELIPAPPFENLFPDPLILSGQSVENKMSEVVPAGSLEIQRLVEQPINYDLY